MSDIQATNWPVTALCRRCKAEILVCPVLDGGGLSGGTWVVPLVVDAYPAGEQWDESGSGGFWVRRSALAPHVCKATPTHSEPKP